jgi:hypothetical protein
MLFGPLAIIGTWDAPAEPTRSSVMTAFVPSVHAVVTSPVPFSAVERFVTATAPPPMGARVVPTAQLAEITAETRRSATRVVVADARKEAAMMKRVAANRTELLSVQAFIWNSPRSDAKRETNAASRWESAAGALAAE